MALTGSQKAYKQARSGIARSGATRSGYYLFRAVVTIYHNGTPIDVSDHVRYNGWSVSLNINDALDTAALQLGPSMPFAPVPRSQIRIGFGSADNVTFSGLMLTCQQTREPGPAGRWWYDVTCVDWLAVFDAHLVLAEYPAQSVTTTILDIVARFTQGQFSTVGVAPGLPSVDGFQVINERPSTVLRRLTNLVGGGFYIDALRQVRAWSASIPSPIQESTPQALTDNLASLKTFRKTDDGSQQRTRVIVEGMRTATLLGVEAAPPAQVQEVPVKDAAFIPIWNVSNVDRYLRVGVQWGQAIGVTVPAVDASQNPPGTTVTAAAAIGAGSLFVADAGPLPSGGWIQVAEQVLTYAKLSSTQLMIGAGTIKAPISVGAQVALLPGLDFYGYERIPNPAFPYIWVVRDAVRAQPIDTPVIVVSMKQDQAAAAAIATREGSDGYYEHLIQDGRFSAAGAGARAAAELANFAGPLVTYQWETDDLNAEPGRMQHIALVKGTPVTADVRITNVEITPVSDRDPPRRKVTATRVQPATVLEVWLDDAR